MKIIRGKIKGAQKICVYGPEGIGKSTFASQFPDPLFIDTEGSTKHMDVARLPRPSSWTMLIEQVKYVKNNPNICKTLVIDTADWAELLCIDDICARFKKGGIEEFGYGKGYVYLAEEFGRLLNLLEDLIETGINVVLTAHAQMRKFEQPDEMGAYDRWELKLQKKTAPMVKEWADIVLFANYKTYVVKTDDNKNKAQGGKRVMYTSHHPCWDAKNRHNLPEELPLDYNQIAHCITSHSSIDKPINEPIKPDPEPKKPKIEPPVQPPGQSTAQPPAQQDPEKEFNDWLNAGEKDNNKENRPVQETIEPKLDPNIPKALADLMRENNVTIEEIQKAVASRGYYPADTPIDNYDPRFVDGVLVGAWPQVLAMIVKMRANSGR